MDSQYCGITLSTRGVRFVKNQSRAYGVEILQARKQLNEFLMNSPSTKLLLVVAVAFVLGCASSRGTFDPPRTMTGQIMVVGNEPFTRLAVQVKHEKVYLIHCNEDTRQLLLSRQGRIARLVYNEVRETSRGEELEVLSVTFNSN